MIKCRLAIDEKLTEGDLLNKFLKFPGLEITILSQLPPTVQNMNNLGAMKRFKGVVGIRMAGVVPNPQRTDIYVFSENRIEEAKELATRHDIKALKCVVFVIRSLESNLETEVSDTYNCCGWQYLNEYVRVFLKIPEKLEKRPKKTGKRDEPDHKKIQAEPETRIDDYEPPSEEYPNNEYDTPDW